jgi:hypothetical protein
MLIRIKNTHTHKTRLYLFTTEKQNWLLGPGVVVCIYNPGRDRKMTER